MTPPLRSIAVVACALALAGCTPRARSVSAPPPVVHDAPRTSNGPTPSWLSDTVEAASLAGAGPAQIFARGSGIPGDSLSGIVNVPPGRCALLYARGSSGLEDLDLLVFGEDGSEFGSDEGPDARPTLVLCPETEQRLYVAARVVQGRGLLALGVHDVAPPQSEPVRRAMTARDPAGESVDAWPGLESALAAHRRQIGGEWLDLRRVALPVDARVPTRLSAEIPADRCVDALVLPSEDVARLDLEALDDTGRIFARADDQGERRWTVLCASRQKATVSFEVRPQAGRGLVLFLLSTSRQPRAQLGLSPGLSPPGEAPQALMALGATLTSPGPKAPAHGEKVPLAVGQISSLPLRFEGCARLDLVPEDPLLGFEARVWSRSGQLLGQVEALAASRLFVCVPAGGARLDLIAQRRGGSMRVDIGPSEAPSAEMAALPLAASRILGRLDFRARTGEIPKKLELKRLELSREQLTRVELEIAKGRCLEFYVGLDAGGAGVEMRAIDPKSGAEMAFDRGSESGFLDVCAEPKQARPIAIELRSPLGKIGAIWTSRSSELQ